MQSKDAARIFGRIGFFLPLFLIFLIGADAAFACPQHTSKAAYRTTRIATRTVPTMASTVITYKAPRTYRRCGDNLFDTRGARYVAARGDRYNGGARYVAVRNGRDNGYYRTRQARYVAVRNIDRYDAPRYVALRREQPVNVDSGVRYVVVRRAEPRVRYVRIQEFEDDGYDDEIRYVKTRRNYDSGSRYVAVRGGNAYYEAPRIRYVAVRSNINTGCARPVALRSCLDDVETTSVRRVVVRNDGYANRTNYVAVRDEFDYRDHEDFDESDGDSDVTVSGEIDDDAEYFVQPTQRAGRVKYVDNRYADSDDVVYVASNRMGNNCMRQVAVRGCPEAYSTRTISYAPVSYYDDDLDDQAYLDGGGATYVAAGDIEDACLSTIGARRSPAMVSTRSVSYVPVDDVDDYAFHSGSGSTYIETEQPDSEIAYIAADENEAYIDADTNYVAADDMDTDAVSYVPIDEAEHIDAEGVSYVPENEGEHIGAESVSYVPVEEVEDIDAETVSYVPAERMNVRAVSYVPADSAYDVDATYTAASDCPELVSNVEAEPVYVVDASTVMVETGDAELVAGLHGTQRIAGSYGFRDGFEDGQEAVLERDECHPENSGDFQKATEGYEDEYGDKGVYKGAYRNTYLHGYREGFESSAGLA